MSVGTALLWWKFYEESGKLWRLSHTFNQTSNETSRMFSDSFNETSETVNATVTQVYQTADEMDDKNLNKTNIIHIPPSLALPIFASVCTVRC